MGKTRSYLRLMRPPNLLTAVSDIWAGVALSGLLLDRTPYVDMGKLVLLSVASMLLYAGGVVFNDVCDAVLDATERPERPIPSGQISKGAAAWLGIILLTGGILLGTVQSLLSGCLALLIAIASLIYDRWGKHHSFFGPLNMGLCRGLNLLLGMSIFPFGLWLSGWLAVVPIVYIGAITMISRGEVHGGGRSSLMSALILYVMVIGTVVWFGYSRGKLLITLVFLLGFAIMVFLPLSKALRDPSGPRIGRAVKAGVLGLILLNASWVAAGSGILPALLTALLLPVSVWVARYFAVT